MWYISSGDQFVGHCLAMLPLLWMELILTGVPHHVAALQELHSLKVKQQSLIDNFISKVKTAIEECDLASGSLSEQRL